MRQGSVCLRGSLAAMVLVILHSAPLLVRAQTAAAPALFWVTLSTTEALPEAVRTVVADEVEAIWAREGVTIVWEPMPLAGASAGMRVLVVSTAGGASDRGHHWPVAELLHDGGGGPLAVASVAAARRVLETAGLVGEPEALADRRLGVVLGRAIAHEIGHHLLATASHSRRGLMRARIEAHEFADLRRIGFGLDARAASRVRAALMRDAAVPTSDGASLALFQP